MDTRAERPVFSYDKLVRSGQFSATINYVMTILRLALGFGVAVGRRWWRTGVERETETERKTKRPTRRSIKTDG